THERTYLGADFATVASRLSELTQVIDGPEIIFDPRLAGEGTSLSWHMLTGTPELVSATHSWDARRRAVPLIDLSVEEDASHDNDPRRPVQVEGSGHEQDREDPEPGERQADAALAVGIDEAADHRAGEGRGQR
ncbi:MAG: hypothetical protein Q605_AUC00686G0001, partial [Actinomyces urogenitalis DORA_12]